MNRIITIALATLIPAAATSVAHAAEAKADRAPRVDARQHEADRAYVQSVGILGMLRDGSAAATVLSAGTMGPELDRAVRGLQGRRLAATGPGAGVRAASTPRASVSIGAIRVSSTTDIELSAHRAHRLATPKR
jgi:hypothetical protein